MWTLPILSMLLAVGAFAGIIAGLFGVGGGLILVPVILWLLQMQGFGELAQAQHIAIGSSFAVMVFTSFSSAWTQYRKQAIEWRAFRPMSIGEIIGVALGAVIAQYLPNKALQIFFIVFTSIIAIRSLLGIKSNPQRQLPSAQGLGIAAAIIGILSSWVGIGGGAMTVPYLTYCNIAVHRAIGTSAALGWPIALAGATGYAFSGQNIAALPPYSLGFIYLPAILTLAITTMLTAPLGVKLSHRLPADKLKKAFGIFLLCIVAKMIDKIFF